MSETPVRDDHKTENSHIPEIPSHWIFKRDKHPVEHPYFCWSPFTHFLHHLFCVIGLGHASLHQVWKMCHPGCPDDVWENGRDRLRERLEHINIVVRVVQSFSFPFIEMSGLGWFAPFCHDGVLHHRSSWGWENITVHDNWPVLRPAGVCRFCPRRFDRGVCCRVRDS